ncbi:MAG: GNAT family N-acetyltransferase [Anaerolineae bacterium]|nr:GNAT family N-acetyltransferase [Anaerolineae bacterium]
MRTIKKIDAACLDEWAKISANAFPGMKINSVEEMAQLKERLEKGLAQTDAHSYGLFEDETLKGVMRLFDFTMNLHGHEVAVGGLGSVSVDLVHKKKKVARDMVAYFLKHYQEQEAVFTALYPFRPDFYKKMGFGHSTPMTHYTIAPASFPKGTKEHISFLDASEAEAVKACYGRYQAKTHGMMSYPTATWDSVFEDVSFRVVGYKDGDAVRGYLLFKFEPVGNGNFLANDMLVRAFIYESTEVMHELLAFLHAQADQINRVILTVQDENLHYLLSDPRNGSGVMLPGINHETAVTGLGIMFRVLDVPRLFEAWNDRDFGGQTCRLCITVRDSFLEENDGSTVVYFENGRSALQFASAHYDVEITLDVSDFSSLAMGAVTFKQLLRYGLVTISDPAYTDVVNRLFWTEDKPQCLTTF